MRSISQFAVAPLSLRAGLSLAAALAVLVLAALALHWRGEAAEGKRRAEAAQRQTRVNTATTAASDAAARDVRIILQTGHQEVEHVQTLPGAETPIHPARRAALCAGLGRVLDDDAVCAKADPDGEPARAVPDAAR